MVSWCMPSIDCSNLHVLVGSGPLNLICFNNTWLKRFFAKIDHFTVVCSVTWPLNESESGVDLAYDVLMLISSNLHIRKAVRFLEYQSKVNSSLTFIQSPGN